MKLISEMWKAKSPNKINMIDKHFGERPRIKIKTYFQRLIGECVDICDVLTDSDECERSVLQTGLFILCTVLILPAHNN